MACMIVKPKVASKIYRIPGEITVESDLKELISAYLEVGYKAKQIIAST